MATKTTTKAETTTATHPDNWQELRGQEHLKRAMEVAAAGDHSLLVICVGCTRDDHLLRLAMNDLGYYKGEAELPCPCGNFGSPERACLCSSEMIARWRFETRQGVFTRHWDMGAEMSRSSWEKLTSGRLSEPAESVRQRIARAKATLTEERIALTGSVHGALYLGQLLPMLDGAGLALLKAAHRQLDLSQAELTATLQVARTISVLAGVNHIGPAHLAEAVQYRPRRYTDLAAQ